MKTENQNKEQPDVKIRLVLLVSIKLLYLFFGNCHFELVEKSTPI